MLNQRRFIVGAALIAAAVVLPGLRRHPDHLDVLLRDGRVRRRSAAHAGEDLRVKGWVRAGSMHWDPPTNELAFELARKDGTEPVPVAYSGILPDMFAEGREVVVEGRYGQGALSREADHDQLPVEVRAAEDGADAEAQPPAAEPMPELGVSPSASRCCARCSRSARRSRGALTRRADIVRSGEHAAYAVFGLVALAVGHPPARAAHARLLARVRRGVLVEHAADAATPSPRCGAGRRARCSSGCSSSRSFTADRAVAEPRAATAS